MERDGRTAVRAASSADAEVIARIQAETMVWCGYYADSIDEASEFERLQPRISGYLTGTYDPSFALPERTVIVAEKQGVVVGFAAGHASTRMGCEAELQWMFVLPAWHRQGIGASLLRPMAAWFAERSYRRVIVDAGPGNPFRGFYLRFGALPMDGHWLHWPDIATASGEPA